MALGLIPFLLAVGVQGIPLDGKFATPEELYLQDKYNLIVERVTAAGSNSLGPAIILGGSYLFAALVLLRAWRIDDWKSALRSQWPIVLLLLLSALSVLWNPNGSKVLFTLVHGVGSTLVALCGALAIRTDARRTFLAVSRVTSINLLTHLGAVVLIPDIAIAGDGRWRGLADHSNVLGSIAFFGVWAASASLLYSKKAHKKESLLALIIGVVLLVGSGSTTSTVTAATAVLLLFLYRTSLSWPRSLRILANAAIVSSLLVVAAFSAASQALLPVLLGWMGKSADFTGRTEIWQSAWRLISEKPVLGWGFDDNAQVISETGFAHMGYHNGYLDLMVRGGVVAITLLAAALVIYLRQGRRIPDKTLRAAFFSFVASAFLYNISEVTFFAPRNILWTTLVLVFCASALSRKSLAVRESLCAS